jgi:enoyl-CoA hydratase/carnithine racemase
MHTETVKDGRVRIDVEEGVAMFTVVRPEKHNALDLVTIDALDDFVQSLAARPELHVAILAGEGGSFVAGGDLVEFSKLKGEDAGRALSLRMGKILRNLEALPQISIAALTGHAYGGGVELCLACDLRIAERDALMGLTQAKFGLTTAWGGTARLVRAVGYSNALDLLLNRRIMHGEEAFQMGLVNRVVESGHAVGAAWNMGRDIAGLGRDLVVGIKRLAQSSDRGPMEDAFVDETATFSRLWAGEQHERLVRTFMERERKP